VTIAPAPRATVPFWDRLDARGDATALVTPDGPVRYAELADRVRTLAEELGPTRRLVALEARNDLDTVVGLLACLAGRHPVLPLDPARPSTELLATYDPDVVLGATLTERRPGTAHDLHPDLAMLLSTSGSTGSPKLVRLSVENLTSNAAAIGSFLGIRPTDVAATTLPLHYCYGLSVLTSHLAAGAAVVLTGLSVVDPCFWELARRERVTTFPGVPHTFDLLDRVGFEAMEVPSLRYLTVAGGRLAPAAVRRYAALGQQRGFDLFVMYGATEATARMAYLPPDLQPSPRTMIGTSASAYPPMRVKCSQRWSRAAPDSFA
jgi:acyl-CoA synthetase (AMP-forming)/AMP-acid ligase II